MQISRRDRMFILVGLPVVLIIVAVNYLIPPAAPAGKGALLPLADAQKKIEEAQHTETRIKSEEAEIQPRIQQLAYTEPVEELVPRIIRDLQETASKSGVHLREIKPLRPGSLPGNNGSRIPIEVHFRAPFQPNAVKFLYYVEDPSGKMVVEKLDITSADAKFKTVDVTAQITVFTRAQTKDPGASGGDTNDVKDKTDKS